MDNMNSAIEIRQMSLALPALLHAQQPFAKAFLAQQANGRQRKTVAQKVHNVQQVSQWNILGLLIVQLGVPQVVRAAQALPRWRHSKRGEQVRPFAVSSRRQRRHLERLQVANIQSISSS